MVRVKTSKPKEGEFKKPNFSILKKAAFGEYDEDAYVIESFQTVSTGIPTVDKMLGGGVVLGGVVELMGLEAAGKSTLAACIAAEGQKRGMPVFYMDTECATTMARLEMIGINTEELIYVQPNCLEDLYLKIKDIINAKVEEKAWEGPAIIIWDSLAATPAKREIEGDEFDKEMAIRARVNSAALRKLIKPLQNAEIAFIVVNQLRENVGQMFGTKYSSPGGHAVKYAAVQRIEMKIEGVFDIDRAAGVVGRKIGFKTAKNKIYQPLLETTAILNHKTGIFDVPQTAFEVLKSEKRITSSGPTWVLNLGDVKTDDNVVKFKRVDWPTVYQENKSAIDEIIS